MEATALEQILREDPDDVAAWRAYGDVLHERGDKRGKLIELEERLARAVGEGARKDLEEESGQLVADHQQEWDAGLPPGVEVLARRHGFATKIAATWSDEAPALIGQALAGRFVTALRIRPGAETEEADAEYWGDEPDFDEDNMPLPAPPHKATALADLDFGGLTELDLSYFRFGDEGAEAVAAAASKGRFTKLGLRYCGIGDAGLAALAGSGHFDGVRQLHFQHNSLSGDGVAALAGFPRLEELDLRYNSIGSQGAQALAALPFTGSLKRLLLHREDVGDDGVPVLAHASRLPTALRSFWRSV